MDIYQMIKTILGGLMLTGLAASFVFLIKWLAMFLKKDPDKGKRKKTAVALLISMVMMGASMMLHLAVSVKQYTVPFDLKSLATIEVASDNLKESVWDREIGAKNGNLSPALEWKEVAGASEYRIVMIDESADNWLHWSVRTENPGTAEGEFKDREAGYVGPYPPSGTHRYTVYVFALKGACRDFTLDLDKGGLDFDKMVEKLNDGVMTDYDNIAAVGTLTGEYSH